MTAIGLQPKQRELLRWMMLPGASWVGYGGSRGGAKSYAARAALVLLGLSRPNRRLVLMRRTWPQLRENHVEPMRREYPQLFAWGWHEQNRELRLPNGSAIGFRYAENLADVNAMIGKEYWIAAVDQAEAFTERELVIIKTCCRWPGAEPGTAKLLLTFNPGNVGLPFLKRVFLDKKYHDGEEEGDYAFIQAYGWDNWEWSRAALERAGKRGSDYYAMPEKERFQFFISKTQYGKELNALPQALKVGWLLGEMSNFAGQYYDCFDPGRHVGDATPAAWAERWLGIDWGFAHQSACVWCARDERGVTQVYREFVAAGRSPKALAQEIAARTPQPERRQIAAAWLSHDAFAHSDERETIAGQIGEVFAQEGLPAPWPASRDVIGSSALIYDLLREDKLIIGPDLANLIATLPMVTRADANPEHPVKFLGDDSFDALRYALKDRLRPGAPPPAAARREEAARIADPVARWFYLLKTRDAQGPAVQPRYLLPSGREV